MLTMLWSGHLRDQPIEQYIKLFLEEIVSSAIANPYKLIALEKAFIISLHALALAENKQVLEL